MCKIYNIFFCSNNREEYAKCCKKYCKKFEQILEFLRNLCYYKKVERQKQTFKIKKVEMKYK